ncbi:hypothetical protein [Pseudomonas syringae]|uniref:hypothetical protein n=1 Tax=Pseudomonas syringae TaxID=317 RepID=UPI001070B1DD|nr:hypothetical protein [Pseudomonas syringae]MEE5168801.1 hypothetical protein [Pseudomonas alliivorans]
MSLQDFWSLPPLTDEVFSSWLFRRTLNDRWMDSNAPLMNLFTVREYGESYFDPDYGIGGADFISCCQAIGDIPTKIGKLFEAPQGWVIPRTVRRSYCIECMKESIGICGLPVYRRSWGLVMMPFCNQHGELLHQGSFNSENKMSLGLDLFKKHWDNRLHEIDSTLLNKTFPWLQLSRNIQATLSTAPLIQSQLLQKILMQLFLSRHFSFTSYEAEQNLWRSTGSFFEPSKHSSRSSLHYDALMACTIIRAKALLYLGRVLNLISDEEMATSLGGCYFMPKSLVEMIAHIGRAKKYSHPYIAYRRLQCFVDDRTPKEIITFVEGLKHVLRA